MVFGLVAASTVTQYNPVKGLLMVMLGLLLGTVGTDINSGVVRYDLGFFELYEGISFIAIAMGLFGVSEVIFSITESVHKPFNQAVTLRSMIPTRAEIRQAVLPVLRGAGSSEEHTSELQSIML